MKKRTNWRTKKSKPKNNQPLSSKIKIKWTIICNSTLSSCLHWILQHSVGNRYNNDCKQVTLQTREAQDNPQPIEAMALTLQFVKTSMMMTIQIMNRPPSICMLKDLIKTILLRWASVLTLEAMGIKAAVAIFFNKWTMDRDYKKQWMKMIMLMKKTMTTRKNFLTMRTKTTAKMKRMSMAHRMRRRKKTKMMLMRT